MSCPLLFSANYLCLSELELSRDVQTIERHSWTMERLQGVFVLSSKGGLWRGVRPSCEWDHWVGGNFGLWFRALVGQSFLLTCLFPPLAPPPFFLFFLLPALLCAASAFLPKSSLYHPAHDDMCNRVWQPRSLLTLYLREPIHLEMDNLQLNHLFGVCVGFF